MRTWVEREPMWDGNGDEEAEKPLRKWVEREPMWDGNFPERRKR